MYSAVPLINHAYTIISEKSINLSDDTKLIFLSVYFYTRLADYNVINFIGTHNTSLRYPNSGKTDDLSQILIMIVGSITAVTVVLF